MRLATVTLDDKYELDGGRAFLSGTQALVRLPLVQRRLDREAGLDTRGYISGYRGSPLGIYDKALWDARQFLERGGIHFNPGLNEDLAATAIWGTQQIGLVTKPKHDGVFGIWYGKGPGVDRTGDAFRHANSAGTAPHGGVLALLGDDHLAKSSTTAHHSELAMVHAQIPILNPANVQDLLDFGLRGWAMSRFSGLWVSMKCITATIDSSASVYVDPERAESVIPDDFEMPEGGLSIRWPDDIHAQEHRMIAHRLPAAQAFARANGIDTLVWRGPSDRIGIAATGKGYAEVREALDVLGIDAARAQALGLRLWKVGMSWPLEEEGARAFLDGLEEVIVVEEKRALVETQLKDIAFHLANRPDRIVGKTDDAGYTLIPATGELTPAIVAKALSSRIARLGASDVTDALARFEGNVPPPGAPAPVERTPYFCSGCPHNSSTKIPDGSMAMAGIGCHYMAVWANRNTHLTTHMGAEGANWIGMEEFVEEPHIFQNLGDGTYQHSGLLAIRAAVSAGTSITYKVLYNDAVAMTGGQPHDGALTPEGITHQLRAEGVRRLAVVTDEPDKYGIGRAFAEGTTIHHRSELDAVQKELRSWPGVSAMVYDQTCAAEKRRRRKRGLLDDPDRRVFINELVCEGCGDCSKASNCISVEPLETEFGRKRQINQSACNKDFSCVQGFCPSFVTVSGAQVRKAPPSHDGAALSDLVARLPDPSQPDLDRPRNVVITGIGGTGVVTVGAVLGMAAHIEGKGVSVLDQVGLSQKGGAVLSEVRLAARPEDIHSVTVGRGRTDLLLGCDMVVAADAEVRGCLNPNVSAAVVNAHRAPVAQFVLDPDLSFGTRRMMELIAESSREEATDFVDATRLATTLFGDSIAGNLMLLGYAVQRGHVPVGVDALERAIELNGVAVRMNLDAFRWGRVAAGDENAIGEILGTDDLASEDHEDSLDHLIERRVQFLTAYQNRSWAERYRETVASVRTLEAARVPGEESLARATAKYLFKLMAYKDEYEVARLYTDGTFLRRIKETFTGRPSLTFHLAPPLFAPRDPATGKLRKLTFGPWMLPAFRVLARLRFLRGTPFDPFGWTRERRSERAEIRRYEGLLQTVGELLSPDNHPTAVALASLPEHVRGFGHVKEEHLARARTLETELLAAFDAKEDAPHEGVGESQAA